MEDVPQEAQTETPQPKTEAKVEEKQEGLIPETTTIIAKADAVAQRMEEANKKAEELLVRSEAMNARMMLAGRTEAGTVTKSPEEEVKEKAKKEAEEIVARFNPPRVGA